MRILRLKISSEMVNNMGLKPFFERLEYMEIINVWQYSKTDFFSVQKLVFKDKSVLEADHESLMNQLNASYLQILRRRENEIICILKQHRDDGFWPAFLPGAWALIPPILIDHDYILLTLVAPKEYVQNLFQMVKLYTSDYSVLAVERMDNVERIEELLGVSTIPFPTFTDRQREIASYAVRHGFYQSPKNISAQAIADEKGISVSAVNEHLRKVERVVMDYFFGEKSISVDLKKKKWYQRINPFKRK